MRRYRQLSPSSSLQQSSFLLFRRLLSDVSDKSLSLRTLLPLLGVLTLATSSLAEPLSLSGAWLSALQKPAQEGDDKSEQAVEKSLTKFVEKFEKIDGYQVLYWDASSGKLWWQIDRFGEEFLYVTGLSSGLGSNPVGLDRGQVGDTSIVYVRRVGKKVYLEQRNLRYRASSDNPLERKAVADSFARSILWSADVEVEDRDGRVLVDVSSLLLRDAHGVVKSLSGGGQGSFSLDKSRSYIEKEWTKGFPDNTEVEVVLTFDSSSPGARVRETTPSPQAVTLRQHHSFVRLPDEEYSPRKFDPRAGGFAVTYADYSSPLGTSIERRLITRHRLQKKNPEQAVSEPIEPIIYYLDPGVPEPVRGALLDGARWWNAAFESAGFKNAYQVKLLPEDADPMDVRYNMIQWVHRSTRGWSYGQSVVDPRTGEIIKGHVLLGSLRVRQDQLIFEGLGIADAGRAAQANGSSQPNAVSASSARVAACQALPSSGFAAEWIVDPELTPESIALARIRQLSAHEVGHTLGFAHNFAASTYGERASVMDYPAPKIVVREDGSFDLSDAYGIGVGEWDHFAVRYAYSEFAPGTDEEEELSKLLEEAQENQWLFLSDSDARPADAADPRANLWDNGTDAVDELLHLWKVRQLALEDFGADRLESGRPLADLEIVLAPIYLLHRYQVDATAKMLGGKFYRYAFPGDGGEAMSDVPAKEQRRALEALMVTLDAEQLSLPAEILRQIPPSPQRSINDVERFSGRMSMVFDPVAAAATAADMTLDPLFQVERLNRIAMQSSYGMKEGDETLSVEQVLSAVVTKTWGRLYSETPRTDADEDRISIPDAGVVQRTIRQRVIEHLLELANRENAYPDVVSAADRTLRRLSFNISQRELRDVELSEADRNFFDWSHRRISHYLEGKELTEAAGQSLPSPPGSPIGASR